MSTGITYREEKKQESNLSSLLYFIERKIPFDDQLLFISSHISLPSAYLTILLFLRSKNIFLITLDRNFYGDSYVCA
jgi:hypothetical protein